MDKNILPKKHLETHIVETIKQVQSGDTQAYHSIIRRFQKQMFLYCFYLLKDHQEAEDATQDIFIKGLQNIHSFSQQVSFSAWLYKIAHNFCNDLLKKKSRNNKLFLLYKNKEQEVTPTYSGLINELLDVLSLEDRQILLLRALEEYSYDEIASIMGMTTVAVRKRYERLRKKLIHTKEMGTYEHSIYNGR